MSITASRFGLPILLGLALAGCGADGGGTAPPPGESLPTKKTIAEAASAAPARGLDVPDERTSEPSPARVRTGVRLPRSADARLPSERIFIAPHLHALSGGMATKVLESDDFEAFVLDMKDEMATDRDAMDLADFYREQMSASLGDLAAVEDLACGTGVCIGSVRGDVPAPDGTSWAQAFFASPDTPHHSLIYREVDLGDGTLQTRFVIGTDPEVGGTAFPSPRPGGG